MLKKLSLILLLVLCFVACDKKKVQKLEAEKFLFGTYIKIMAYDSNTKDGKAAIEAAFEEIARIDKEYNSKSLGSVIYNLNNSKSKEIEIDNEGIALLNSLQETYKLSKGKYDVTISPLLNLWGFTEDSYINSIPSKEDIEKIKAEIDFSKVKILGNKVKLESPIEMIDTGSFLKGYALEKAKEKMEQLNIKSAFLTSISSITTIGTKPDNKPWRVGIQNPDDPSKIIGIVSLSGESMGVSGDYQTYVEIGGKKYHHILDKDTGYPVKDKKMVVVITPNAFKADMYSTAFFLMPIEDILNYVKDKNIKVLIVDSKDEIITSSNFEYEKIK
ncbi:FAD:protein FMN transferase [Cetobacterium sp. SF1]|uniref:FAD:protein FMN transferase n=1 Tax=Cetobacterium sp. SF1 TaxID=3417654 RepID=UPI003CF3C716